MRPAGLVRVLPGEFRAPDLTEGIPEQATHLLDTVVLLVGLRAGLQATLSFGPPLATLVLSSLFGFEPEPPSVVRAAVAKIDLAALESPAEPAELLNDRPTAESDSADARTAVAFSLSLG